MEKYKIIIQDKDGTVLHRIDIDEMAGRYGQYGEKQWYYVCDSQGHSKQMGRTWFHPCSTPLLLAYRIFHQLVEPYHTRDGVNWYLDQLDELDDENGN